jgi:hypothetical protein
MSELHSEFQECLMWWTLTFFIGISLREFSKDTLGRWIGRAGVATSCFVLIAFAELSMHRCQLYYSGRTQNDIQNNTDQGDVSVQKIADLDAPFNLQVTTKAGNTFEWSNLRRGGQSLSTTTGRIRRSIDSGRRDYSDLAGASNRFDGMSDAAKQF